MTYAFHHVHLKAPDPEKTANWYIKAFNFRIVRDQVRIRGDRFIRCEMPDGTVVNITGGSVGGDTGNYFKAFSGSTVNISGGSISGPFLANGSSTVNISGGSVGGVDAHHASTVNISGG